MGTTIHNNIIFSKPMLFNQQFDNEKCFLELHFPNMTLVNRYYSILSPTNNSFRMIFSKPILFIQQLENGKKLLSRAPFFWYTTLVDQYYPMISSTIFVLHNFQ